MLDGSAQPILLPGNLPKIRQRVKINTYFRNRTIR